MADGGTPRAGLGQSGSVAVITAIVLVVLLGFASLGTDIGFALYKHRQMQSVAGAAAMGGATALMTGHPASPTTEALAIANAFGFTNGSGGVTVTVNSPPLAGSYKGNASAVEVIVAQPQSLPVAAIFIAGNWTVSARSVAIIGNPGLYCIGALDTSASGAVTLSNNAVVLSTTCGVASNSSSSTGIYLSNNTTIDGPVSSVGNWKLSNGAKLNGSPLISGAIPFTDPYANVTLGTVPACTGQTASGKSQSKVSLTPGHFCSGWDFQNCVEIDLAPGTYYVDSKLALKNNGTINATGGVTIVINGNYAMDLGNNGALNLTAPSTGNFAGLALVDLSTTKTVTQDFANNTTLKITGAVYLRNQTLQLDNNGISNPGSCTQMLARMVVINNNAELDNNCAGTGVKPVGVTPATLVE